MDGKSQAAAAPQESSPSPIGRLGSRFPREPRARYGSRGIMSPRGRSCGPDLGFLAGNALFVTGRIKDLIIHRGENLHPADVEATVLASDPRLGPAAAVFATEDEEEG